MDTPKILLIQVRASEALRDHEYTGILKYSGLKPEQIQRFHAYEDSLDPSVLTGIDAVIVGGSGECNVSRREPTPQFDGLIALVQTIVERKLPLIGLCYGGHLLAAALGGVVEYRPTTKEVGSSLLHRLATCPPDDPLLGDMPSEVWANCGRTDDIMQLPLTAVPLYNSDKVQFHAFKIAGLPIYGFQSHPELGKTEHTERLRMSLDFGKYVDEDSVQAIVDSIHETPEWNGILKRFIEMVSL
jgi:GMP synthase-like glutamine amidotransferase